MKVELLSEPAPVFLPMLGRSRGVHVSQIIGKICLKMGYYEQRDLSSHWANLGNALEYSFKSGLESREPGRYRSPGELCLDDTYGTPDLLDLLLSPLTVLEIKLAWMSSSNGPGDDKFWRYETQVKAYCHMLETGCGKLCVYHVNGDYVESREPVYHPWYYQFTRSELAENWRMLMKYKDRLLRSGELVPE